MRVSTKGRYALRACLALASIGEDGAPVSISTLAEKEDISSVFLEQIFFRLRKAGIVASTRGPGGGFSFAKPLENITVKELVDAAGENLELSLCNKSQKKCTRVGDCMSHHIWVGATDMVNGYFHGITLSSILKDYKKEPIPATT
ncbi:MAG: Rrf2 family transcriptional regulator [Treponema sp.]|jgi:Rrf2 family iron-sulfur cluster assembly transcriptional regulator|nr:Rrf2 family transcriptional regulator [Treponema sp.]